jgi:hypothetical protein
MRNGIKEVHVTIEQMKHMVEALEGLSNELLPKDPRLFSLMAEAPLEHLSRMRCELEQRLSELKQATPVSS